MRLQPEQRDRFPNEATANNARQGEAFAESETTNLTPTRTTVPATAAHPSRCCNTGVHFSTEISEGVRRCIWCGFTFRTESA